MDNASEFLITILIIAGAVLIFCVIRYVIGRVVFGVGDAVQNAYRREKNKTASDKSENLSDRYKFVEKRNQNTLQSGNLADRFQTSAPDCQTNPTKQVIAYCPECGTPVEPGNTFCSNCGTNLEQE